MTAYRIRTILYCIATTTSLALLADPTFHLKNKSNIPIQVQVNNGPVSTIQDNGSLPIDANIATINTMSVYYCPTAAYCRTNKPDSLLVQFPAGGQYTTMYLKFDLTNGVGKITPQQGNIFGKSTEGYSLSRNIRAENIQQRLTQSAPTQTNSTTSLAMLKDLDTIQRSLSEYVSKQTLDTMLTKLKTINTSREAQNSADIKNLSTSILQKAMRVQQRQQATKPDEWAYRTVLFYQGASEVTIARQIEKVMQLSREPETLLKTLEVMRNLYRLRGTSAQPEPNIGLAGVQIDKSRLIEHLTWLRLMKRLYPESRTGTPEQRSAIMSSINALLLSLEGAPIAGEMMRTYKL